MTGPQLPGELPYYPRVSATPGLARLARIIFRRWRPADHESGCPVRLAHRPESERYDACRCWCREDAIVEACRLDDAGVRLSQEALIDAAIAEGGF